MAPPPPLLGPKKNGALGQKKSPPAPQKKFKNPKIFFFNFLERAGALAFFSLEKVNFPPQFGAPVFFFKKYGGPVWALFFFAAFGAPVGGGGKFFFFLVVLNNCFFLTGPIPPLKNAAL